MRPWKEAPNVGKAVTVPDPLPPRWLQDSAEELQLCQEHAQLWHDDLLDDGYVDRTDTVPRSSLSAATPTDVPTHTSAMLSRSWVLDSGSAHHIQDKNELSLEESDRIRVGQEHILETANGDRTVNEHIDIRLPPIGLRSSDALAMDDCPSLLSVGQLVEVDGFRQLWDPTMGYLLQDPRGQWYRVPVYNRIPEISFDDLERILPPSIISQPPPPTTKHHIPTNHSPTVHCRRMMTMKTFNGICPQNSIS